MFSLNFNQQGGFPIDTNILDNMQQAYKLFNCLAFLAGDRAIISGCVVNGNNTSSGHVSINGEILPFEGGITTSKVIIVTEVVELLFEDQVSRPVVTKKTVRFGSGPGELNWSDFKRVFPANQVQQQLSEKASATALTQLANLVNSMVEKLNTIEEGAQVNVQPNWAAGPQQSGHILNKPQGSLVTYLHRGTFTIGDVINADNIRTVNFPSVGTANYVVLATLVAKSSNWNQDNDVIFMIADKTESSFKILLREVSGNVQNLDLEYLIIA